MFLCEDRSMAQVVAKGDRLLNRELSFLDVCSRVLDLAADPALPILERVRFCGICSSMTDEFFMIRVAGLMGQAASGLAGRLAKLWARELTPALAENGILIGSVDDCTPEEFVELETRFEREIFPILTPLAVGPGQPFPYISALSLSLAVFVADPDTGE